MKTTGYTRLDYEKMSDTINELNTRPIIQLTENYRCDWKSHAPRMPCWRILLQRTSLGRPFRCWQETVTDHKT